LIVVLLFTALVGPELTSRPRATGLALRPAVVEAQDPPPPAPVWGIADTHQHQFANLGFGGFMIWGDVFNTEVDPELNLAKAVPWSDFVPGRYGDVLNFLGDSRVPDVSASVLSLLYPNVPATCPPGTGGIFEPPCQGFSIHGPLGIRDLINLALSENFGHSVAGYPQFDGYPRWNTYTGQQMYYKWLERAWREGGLRLTVMFAVNNEALCKAIDRKAGYTCDDMPAIDRQIQAAKDLERFIDQQSGGPGRGWYRIAYSPQQARQIINEGKLAVVLGIEAPSLFGCKVESDCTDEYVLTELKRYRDMGVRHIYPLHNADNGFGGTGLYNQIFTINTKVINNRWFNVTDACDERIDFHLDLLDALQPDGGSMPSWLVDLVYLMLGMLTGDDTAAPRPPAGRNCNARYLQPLGETLVRGIMDLGMIIDVDHLSTRTRDDVLTIAEELHYAGVISSHNTYVELGLFRGDAESMRHEANLLPEEIERIRALGGNVSVIISQPDRSTMQEYVRPDGSVPVPYRCGNSSEAWAQAYLYAVDHMQGGSVALASDHNGLAGLPTPRFGDERCHGDVAPDYNPTNRVVYSTDPSQGLTQMRVGNKYFDYNEDGFANIGMLPDFIQDVRNIGVSEADLAPLFNSAEAYIHMWEQVDPGLPDPPNNAPSAHAGGPYLALAGTSITLQGTGTDPDGDPLSFSWDLDGNGVFETSGASITFTASGPNRDQPVVMRACDSHAEGKQAACSNSRTFVHVRTPGRLLAWGGNALGQLGVSPSSVAACQASARCSPAPVAIPGLLDVVDVAAGKEHSLALKSDGTVWAWGGARGSTPVQVEGLSNVVAIAAGTDHSLALESDGSVWAWGANYLGQLGTGDTAPHSTPVRVPVIGPVTAISAGDRFSLVLQDIGSIVGWGSNHNYQLGYRCWLDGDPELPPAECLSPVVVTGFGGPNIVGIAAGSTWSHALEKDGAVWVMGGSVDYETREVPWAPTRVGGLTRSVAISAGTNDHVLALRDDGYMRGYGKNAWGQAGSGCNDSNGFCWPYTVPSIPFRHTAVAVAAGNGHSLAIDSNGEVWAWGTNVNGQLGNGAWGAVTNADPVEVNYVCRAIGIAAGYDHSLAIVPTTVSIPSQPGNWTSLWLPGRSSSPAGCGQVGLPPDLSPAPITFSYAYQPAPSAEAAGALSPLRYVGSSFTLVAHDANGNAVTAFPTQFSVVLRYDDADWQRAGITDERTLNLYWWDTAANQWRATLPCDGCSLDMTVNSLHAKLDHLTEFALLGEPGNRAPVAHPGGPYLALAGSTVTLHGAGSDPDGDAISFEWDLDGDGAYEVPGQDVPFTASGPSRDVPIGLRTCDARGACSYSRSFVHVRAPGRILAWGLNDAGQLGVPPSAVGLCGGYRCSPTALAVPGLQDVVDVAAGGAKSFALTSDGTVREWGGATGSTPTLVTGLDHVVGIAAGRDHVLALKDDGSVWAWGENDYGQLGIGNVGDQTAPVRVSAIGPAVAIAAGDRYSLVLLDDGNVWGWGFNHYYELGDQCYESGYMFPRECWSPVLVPDLGGRYTVGISAGASWSLAWDDNGVVRLQGGFDPNRDLEPRLSPEQMDGLANSILVSSSTGDHILSRRQDGTVWGYGDNYYSQLGSGCTDRYRCFTAVQVQELPMNPGAALAADTSSFALDEDGTVWAWGNNWAGQLGDGEFGGSRTLPVQATGVTGATALASGGKHSLAVVPAPPPSGAVSVTAQPGVATSLALPHQRGSLNLPAGAVTVPTTFTYTELAGPSEAPTPGTLRFAGLSFTLVARDAAGNPVTTFPVPFTLVLNYQDADWQAAGIPAERLLNLFWWDTGTAGWRGVLPCDGCSLDTVNNRLTAQLNHLTEFALLGWTDNTPPSVAASVAPAANAAGWNKTDATVTLSAVDNAGGSGVQSVTYAASGAQTMASITVNGNSATVVLSAEGQTTLTYAARDNAGNVSASTTVVVQVDKTAPAVSAIASPAPNAAGWNNGDVTVSFSGTDGLSGIAACDADVVLSIEGAGQSASGTCTDLAGNVSVPATVSGINIDRTAPTASAIASPAPNAAGWNNGDVTVSFSGTDGLSGIAACDAAVVLSSEGLGQSASGTCTDLAGNVSVPATVNGINIDRTPPTLNIVTPQIYQVLPVGTALDFRASDTLSGLSGAALATLTNGSTAVPVSSGATVSQAGVYTLLVQATDRAGNQASEERYFVVYDPNGGFVTGGGWIDSPAGAYTPDPTLAGKATFGFVSKYKKGATAPTGNTEFEFRAGNLTFHSSSYEWLVINQSGTNAQFRGSGTINGAGSYKFMLWAGDGAPDTFRIKIWEEPNGVETVVYDNGVQQPIGGGSIVIHKN